MLVRSMKKVVHIISLSRSTLYLTSLTFGLDFLNLPSKRFALSAAITPRRSVLMSNSTACNRYYVLYTDMELKIYILRAYGISVDYLGQNNPSHSALWVGPKRLSSGIRLSLS